MNKKLVQALAVVMAATVSVTAFAGCSKKNPGKNDQTGDQKTPVDLTYFHFWENKGTIDPSLDMVGPVIKDKFNIRFKEIINPTQSPADRLNVLINSGTVPDIMVLPFSELSGASKHGTQGLFLDMTPYIDKYDNLKQQYTPYIKRVLTASDNKVYAIPIDSWETAKDPVYNMQGMWIRKKFAEKLGVKPTDIKTTDDLFTVLNRIKNEIKEFNGKPIIPYGLGGEGWGDSIFYYLYGANWHNLMEDDKTISFLPTHPGAKDGVLYINKLMQNGLLEKEAFIHKDEQFREKLAQGRYGMIMHVPSIVFDDYNPLLKKADPDDEYIPVSMPIMKQEHKYFQYPENPGSITVLSAKIKNPERVLEMINWTASDEGYILTTSGTDGKFYTMKDGKAELTQEGIALQKDPKKQENYGLRNWYRFAGFQDKWKKVGGVAADDPRIQEASNVLYANKQKDPGTELYPNPDKVVAPLVPFRNDGWGIIFKIWTDIRPKVAAAPDTNEAMKLWDKAVGEMKKQAADKMQKEFETEYQKQLEILKNDTDAQKEAQDRAKSLNP